MRISNSAQVKKPTMKYDKNDLLFLLARHANTIPTLIDTIEIKK